jgi:hypothetical protein
MASRQAARSVARRRRLGCDSAATALPASPAPACPARQQAEPAAVHGHIPGLPAVVTRKPGQPLAGRRDPSGTRRPAAACLFDVDTHRISVLADLDAAGPERLSVAIREHARLSRDAWNSQQAESPRPSHG